jgi:hypothetical protein
LPAKAHVIGMADKDKAKDRQREERLAAALRENLRRRKAQARTLNETVEPRLSSLGANEDCDPRD